MTADADAAKTSLLAHLANRFTNQTETLATEALGYILSQSAPARVALQEMLMSGDADIGPISRVETEFKVKVKAKEGAKSKEARIDLVGFGEGDAKRALIEVKFWAGLTENQPNTYLDELLKNEEPAALLFVAPELRLDMLWEEIIHLANEAKRFTLGVEMVDAETKLRSAVVNDGPHRLMLTSWRAMLDKMSRKVGDVTVEKDIDQLQALCDQQDRVAFLPLDAGEIGPGFSRRAIDLHNLFHAVVSRVHKGGIWKKIGHSKLEANFGHYFSLIDAALVGDVWIGIHYEFGTRHRETPFWVMLGYSSNAKLDEIRKRLDAARRETGLDYVDTEYGKTPVSLIPIHLPAGVEYEVVLDSVVGQIRKIGEILAAPR